MRKNTYTNCFRCNKQMDLSWKNLSETVKCPHCNSMMRFTYKTVRKVKYVRYLFVLIICFMLAYGMNAFNKDQSMSWLLLSVLAIAMAIAWISEKVCIWIAWTLFGLEYEEYDVKKEKEIRRKREIEKNKAKERKRAK